MLDRNVERVAIDARLHLLATEQEWCAADDWPHIATFKYELVTYLEDSEESVRHGTVDGYRIAQDWTLDDELELWNEADALSSDAIRYIEALIRELRACRLLFELAPSLTMAQRTTIVRHVQAVNERDSVKLIQSAVACLAMMDAPVLMLVDPWTMGAERRTPRGKLRGRAHVPGLLKLGLVRMVGSRFLWGWNREFREMAMSEYSYEALLAAKADGKLDPVLGVPLFKEVYGDIPDDIAAMVDLPEPDDLTTE